MKLKDLIKMLKQELADNGNIDVSLYLKEPGKRLKEQPLDYIYRMELGDPVGIIITDEKTAQKYSD